MFRLNVHIDDEVANRLTAYCDNKRVTKVSVVTTALLDFLDAQAVRDELLNKMKDPASLAEMAKVLGVNLSNK